jgi:hypothetical protein
MMMPRASKYHMIVAARDDLSGFCEGKALQNQTAEIWPTFSGPTFAADMVVPYM